MTNTEIAPRDWFGATYESRMRADERPVNTHTTTCANPYCHAAKAPGRCWNCNTR